MGQGFVRNVSTVVKGRIWRWEDMTMGGYGDERIWRWEDMAMRGYGDGRLGEGRC